MRDRAFANRSLAREEALKRLRGPSLWKRISAWLRR